MQAPTALTTHSAQAEGRLDGDSSKHVQDEGAAEVVLPHSHAMEEPDVHMMMGAALVVGFVVMLLIDQLWKHSHSHSQHGTGGEWCKGTTAEEQV